MEAAEKAEKAEAQRLAAGSIATARVVEAERVAAEMAAAERVAAEAAAAETAAAETAAAEAAAEKVAEKEAAAKETAAREAAEKTQLNLARLKSEYLTDRAEDLCDLKKRDDVRWAVTPFLHSPCTLFHVLRLSHCVLVAMHSAPPEPNVTCACTPPSQHDPSSQYPSLPPPPLCANRAVCSLGGCRCTSPRWRARRRWRR